MSWRLALACLVLAAATATTGRASANGRPAATSSITFRQGNDNDIVAGLTFGLVISHDGGKTWAWMCEDAIGYKGVYDPRYSFSTSSALFASTFVGLKVMRDGCTFQATPAGSTFVSTNVFGPDHVFYYAASQAADPPHGIVADFNIYKSTDDGAMMVKTTGQPGVPVSWWQSLEVAPNNPQRIYLSGYAFRRVPTGSVKDHLLFRTDNGGVTWQQLPVTDLTLAPNSVIDIVGISKTNPDLVYARVELDDNVLSDSIYRSTDKGATWTKIRTKGQAIGAFLVRDNGDLILGTQSVGAEISRDGGDNWTPLVDPPHMNCLVENAAHEIWACTQNFGYATVPSDDAGIMKTTDLVNWAKVMRYQDLSEAVTCASGTPQHDACASAWCVVCMQLGCKPSASYSCEAPAGVEAPAPPAKGGGCCNSRADAGGALALGLVVATLVLRPRRRPERRLRRP
jgi:photosystem II stability/assembly factor-like uncharacterized protein